MARELFMSGPSNLSQNSPPTILIFGQASKTWVKSLYIDPQSKEWEQNLLELLWAHGVRLASSCKAQGQCLKCKINNHLSLWGHDTHRIKNEELFSDYEVLISCQVTLRNLQQNNCKSNQFPIILSVDYL